MLNASLVQPKVNGVPSSLCQSLFVMSFDTKAFSGWLFKSHTIVCSRRGVQIFCWLIGVRLSGSGQAHSAWPPLHLIHTWKYGHLVPRKQLPY